LESVKLIKDLKMKLGARRYGRIVRVKGLLRACQPTPQRRREDSQ
jgi:hypothetical protein